MTLGEALALKVDDYIASPADDPAWRVRRVGDHWANDAGLVRVSCAGYRAGEWISPLGFVVCPPGYHVGDVLKPEHRKPVEVPT